MNTKLYVLGAVLGAVPVLWPEACSPVAPPSLERDEEPRGGVSRQGVRPAGGNGAGLPTPPPVAPPGPASGVPTHPCELITVMQVPCDPSAATCEYTYWECPESVKPLRA
jgi:hypothetical protein